MKGALASRASLRAISVLPTPVGPIIRMFFGVISWRRPSATCWRRQRLRRAIATARFAAFWPTMCLSNSSTISRGVIWDIGLEFFDCQMAVRIDTDIRRDIERALDDVARRQLGSLNQRQGRRLRITSARAEGDQIVLRLDHVAVARNDVGALAVGNA